MVFLYRFHNIRDPSHFILVGTKYALLTKLVFGLIPYGADWVPSLFFTEHRDRDVFLWIADWLKTKFSLNLIEEYGATSPDGKEYWTFETDHSRWMLMRCYFPRGISLDSDSPRDLATFEDIARSVGAKPIGWRYRWACIQRRFARKRFDRFFAAPVDHGVTGGQSRNDGQG